MITLDPHELGTTANYKLLIGSIVPRPIAWISTLSADGKGNLAPFSFFNGVSSNPPCLMVAITRRKGGVKKDTLLNIEATREFVVNIVTESMAAPMNQTSADYPYGVDERIEASLASEQSVRVKPPRVLGAPIQFECVLEKLLEIGEGDEGSSTIVVGRIVAVHVAENVYREGKILVEELKPLARLGGLAYGKTSGVFELPRPKID